MCVNERARHAEALLTEPKYRKLATRNLNNLSNVDDALQEVARVTLEHLPVDHPQPCAWLRLTLKRRCWKINEARDESRSFATDPADWGTALSKATGPNNFKALEQIERIQSIRPHLKDDELNALLDQAAGYSYAETSKRRGWTYTKVNRCISEGRAKLRAAST